MLDVGTALVLALEVSAMLDRIVLLLMVLAAAAIFFDMEGIGRLVLHALGWR